MVTGVAPGLQNQCGADEVPGGFDSHSPPPFSYGVSSQVFGVRPAMIICLGRMAGY